VVIESAFSISSWIRRTVRLDLNRLLTFVRQRRDLRAQRVARSREDVGATRASPSTMTFDAARSAPSPSDGSHRRADALEILGRGFVGVVFLQHEQDQAIRR
jgi:hypothetical protein